MPNHCAQELVITGPEETLQKFKEQAEEFQQDPDGPHLRAFSINKFLPMPEAIQNTSAPNYNTEQAAAYTKMYGYPDWYEWSIGVWGTKWDTFNSILTNEEPNTLTYRYKTAWSPLSETALAKVSEEYPELTFDMSFAEAGMCYWGRQTYRAGQIESDRSGTLSHKYTDEEDYPKMAEYLDETGELLSNTFQELARNSG